MQLNVGEAVFAGVRHSAVPGRVSYVSYTPSVVVAVKTTGFLVKVGTGSVKAFDVEGKGVGENLYFLDATLPFAVRRAANIEKVRLLDAEFLRRAKGGKARK